MSIYDKASLVLIPSGTKTSKVYSQKPVNGDGDFTFSRSTAATRVNADGNIEKETQNLYIRSQEMDNAIWSKARGSVTANATTAPDGTTTADLWTEDTSNGTHDIRQGITTTSGGFYTFSIYAKANGRSVLDVYVGGANKSANFNLTTGLVTGGSAPIRKIEDVGSGWYRVSVGCLAASTTTTAIWILNNGSTQSYTGDGTSGMYFWGAQAEQSLVARDYIETTTTAVEGGITDNVPRLDYTDSSCPALLLEPQRTNSHLHSEYIAGWTTPTSQGFESNSTVSPEGVQNATKIINTNNSNSWIRQLPSVTIGQNQVISCFVKEGNRDIFNITYYDVTDGDRFFNYNLSTQTISGNGLSRATYVDSDIIDYGNGWYRCYVVMSAGNATPQIQMAVGTNRAASANDYIYVWGAQHEQNASYPTSYIPTYGTSVTRGVGTARLNNSSALPTAYPFTMFVESEIIDGVPADLFSFLQSNVANNYNVLQYNGTNFNNNLRDDGTDNTIVSSSTYTTGTHKVAVVVTDSSQKLFVNGVLEATGTSIPPFDTDINDLLIAQLRVSSDTGRRNTTKQALVFNTALTDEELAALTTI